MKMLDGVVISLLLGRMSIISYLYCSFKSCLVSFHSLCDNYCMHSVFFYLIVNHNIIIEYAYLCNC